MDNSQHRAKRGIYADNGGADAMKKPNQYEDEPEPRTLKDRVDEKTRMFMEFFEREFNVEFVDVTDKAITDEEEADNVGR